MQLTCDQLQQIMPGARKRAALFIAPINAALAEFSISSPARAAAFLAQVAHESVELQFVREIASGAAYDTGRLAERLGNTTAADGDGQRYKGRGLLQITGRANYAACGEALGLDLIATPELLERPEHAARSAGWFWMCHGLNALADKGAFDAITAVINGGQNGRDKRRAYWLTARRVLGG